MWVDTMRLAARLIRLIHAPAKGRLISQHLQVECAGIISLPICASKPATVIGRFKQRTKIERDFSQVVCLGAGLWAL